MAAQLPTPSVDELPEGNWRVVAIPGLDVTSMDANERKILVILKDDASKYVICHLPASLAPLIYVGENVKRRRFQNNVRIAGNLIHDVILDPASETIMKAKDRLLKEDSNPKYTLLNRIFKLGGSEVKSIYGGMNFNVFISGDDFYIVPTTEIIRHFILELCSSFLVRKIFEGNLTHMRELSKIINLDNSHIRTKIITNSEFQNSKQITEKEAFIMMRKELTRLDRLIIAHIFNKEGRFALQVNSIIDSLNQDINKSEHVNYPAIRLPFPEPTWIRFSGSIKIANGRRGLKHKIYFVDKILASQFHSEFTKIDFSADNRNTTTASEEELSQLGYQWQGGRQREPHLPHIPELVTSDDQGSKAGTKKYRLANSSRAADILAQLEGEEIIYAQAGRAAPAEDDDTAEAENTLSTGDQNVHSPHVPLVVVQPPSDSHVDHPTDEEPARPVSDKLTSLSELQSALDWIEDELGYHVRPCLGQSGPFPLKGLVTDAEALSSTWLNLKGQHRHAALSEIRAGKHHCYVLEVEKGNESLPLLVFRSLTHRALHDDELRIVLSGVVRVRGRWTSIQGKQWRASADKEFSFHPVYHRYDQIDRYANALLRAGGLDRHLVQEVPNHVTEAAVE